MTLWSWPVQIAANFSWKSVYFLPFNIRVPVIGFFGHLRLSSPPEIPTINIRQTAFPSSAFL
jgi:hypothetical protein